MTLAAFFALGGRLADTVGHKKMVTLGIIVFAGASALFGLTPKGSLAEAWTVTFRAVQGFGGAIMFPAALAIVVQTFPLCQPRLPAATPAAKRSAIDTVLHVSPALILRLRARNRRTTMENLALAEVPAGSDEFDELHKLQASESEPEEEDEEDDQEHGSVEPENPPDE
jgi:Major Facilitator Superfamily